MQDKDIQTLKALAQAATPGPWDFDTAETPIRIAGGEVVGGDTFPYGDVYTMAEYEQLNEEGDPVSEPLTVCSEIGIANGRFIAAANPAAILSLISRIEQQAARIAELEARDGFKPDWAGYRQGLADGAVAVDLSGLTRYEEYGNESGGGLQEAADGDFVRFDDVQALLSSSARDVGGLTDA